MQILFTSFLILQLGHITLSNGQTWIPPTWISESVSLSKDTNWDLKIITENSTEFVYTLEDAYTNENVDYVGIMLWIDSMTCPDSKSPENSDDPNYLILSMNGIPFTWQGIRGLCQNITELTPVGPIKFDTSLPLGSQNFTLRPFGERWSNATDNAAQVSLQVEYVIKKTIVMGSELPQLDLTLDERVEYEIKLNPDDQLCTKSEEWNCSLVMSLVKRECPPNYVKYLQISGMDKMTNENISAQWSCDNDFQYHKNHPVPTKSFESVNSIVLKLSMRKKYAGKSANVIKVTISAQLFSRTEHPKVLPGYFNCNTYSCHNASSTNIIPDDWTCDGKPQCPPCSTGNVIDEADIFCDREEPCFYGSDYFYSGAFNLWYLLFMILFLGGFVTLFMVARSLYIQRFVVRQRTEQQRQVHMAASRTRQLSEVPPPSYSKVTGGKAYTVSP